MIDVMKEGIKRDLKRDFREFYKLEPKWYLNTFILMRRALSDYSSNNNNNKYDQVSVDGQ